eukprot:351897-Chlamydomonas_euryale.AAC.9
MEIPPKSLFVTQVQRDTLLPSRRGDAARSREPLRVLVHCRPQHFRHAQAAHLRQPHDALKDVCRHSARRARQQAQVR